MFGKDSETLRTPVGTPDYGIVSNTPRSRTAGHTEVCELDTTIFIGQDVCTLDISMDHALVMEVHETFENLTNVDGDQSFREFSETLADSM